MLSLWPEIPNAILQDLVAWASQDSTTLVFNRRKRRAVSKAKGVLIHLFAGESRKEIETHARAKGYEVVSVGLQEDFASIQTFVYVLHLAAQGVVDIIFAAPPGGTNSVSRFIQPGPKLLRTREGTSRWGLVGLSPAEQVKVKQADELYLRTLLLMHVAEEGRRRVNKPPTWSLIENPQDPATYVRPDSNLHQQARRHGGFPSFFATREFQISSELLGMRQYHGDQGPYGHEKRRPTTWASTRELPELKKGPGVGPSVDGAVEEEWLAAKCSKWAPGMIRLLLNLAPSLSQSGIKVAKADSMDWEEHVRNGHWPPSRRCRRCIAACARHRAHRRIRCPASWVLSADTIGPFKKAEDETSPDLRYLLIACVVVPVDGKGKPVLGPEQQQAEAAEDTAVEADEELADYEPTEMPDDENHINIPLEELFGPDVEEAPLVGKALQEYEECLKACQQDADELTAATKECKVDGLAWKEVVFVETLRRKTPAATAQALTRILTQAHELGLPVVRLHTDSGSEYVNPQIRKMATRFQLKQTCAAPEEHNSNGRIENIVQRVKNQMNMLLGLPNSDPVLWPLAAKSVVATWRAQTLRQMGMPAPAVVPFGTHAQVLCRSWLRKSKQSWKAKAVDATVLCPASLIKLGYVVRIGKRLSVVTKLFQGEEPPLTITLSPGQDPPMSHSLGPETRVSEKASIPSMSHAPPPLVRYRDKAPGPGRRPVVSAIQPHPGRSVEDLQAEQLAKASPFDVDEAVRFVLSSSYVVEQGLQDISSSNKHFSGQHYLFGVYRYGGAVGLTRCCKQRPGMSGLLAAIAKAKCPEATFSTIGLCVNGAAYPHRDSNNLPTSVSHWIPLKMPKKGGRLWVELRVGTQVVGQPAVVSAGNTHVPGQFHSPNCPAAFSPMHLHGTEDWNRQESRVVLLLYTVNCLQNLDERSLLELRQYGFSVPCVNEKGGDGVHDARAREGGDPGFQDGVHDARAREGADPGFQGKNGELGGPVCLGLGSHCVCPATTQQAAESGEIGDSRIEDGGSNHSGPNCLQFVGSEEKGSSSGCVVRVARLQGDSMALCRICDSEELVNDQGRCSECGCKVAESSVGSSCNPYKARAGFQTLTAPTHPKGKTSKPKEKTENYQNPEKSHNIYPKNCITSGDMPQNRSQGMMRAMCVSGDRSVEPVAGGRCSKQVLRALEGPTGNEREGWHQRRPSQALTCIRSEGLERGVWMLDSGSITRKEAERPSNGLEEADRELSLELREELVCEFDGESDGRSDKPEEAESASEEGGDSHRQDARWAASYERVLDREELRCVGGESLGEVYATRTQQEIMDFESWLDERQLRLASMHEEELQQWIDDMPPASEAAQLKRLEINKLWEDVEDLRLELTQLCLKQITEDSQALAEAQAMPADVHEQVVLQTRIVANMQVMANWELWKPAVEAELGSLIQDKQAIYETTQKELDKLQAQGYKVLLIPSKAIFTIKAPGGKYKCRLVACGNYLSSSEGSKLEHRQTVYTPSIGIDALRTALAFSTRRRHTLITVDIKAAFLNAQLLPRNRGSAEKVAAEASNAIDQVEVPSSSSHFQQQSQQQHQRQQQTQKEKTESILAQDSRLDEVTDEVVALVPPRVLVTQGVFSSQARLIIKKALYGLDQSPRDWSFQRDQALRKIIIRHQGTEYRLYQSLAEDSLWLLSSEKPLRGMEATLNISPETSAIAGWVAVYVDDVLVGAENSLAWAVISAIRERWECSEPQEVVNGSQGKVRFLGIDLSWNDNRDLVLSQASYIRELEQRYKSQLDGLGKPTTPLPNAFDDDAREESSDVEDVRRCQTIVGEMLWASIRTRPDITFSVSKLAAAITRAPVGTYRSALHALAYLVASAECVLIYPRDEREVWKQYKKSTAMEGLLEGYGDASFAPEAKRSMQCVQVHTEGALTGWSCARQAFMAQSSCEAEMIALMELANYTISSSYVFDELLQRRSCKELLGDNVAALALYGGTSASWRTRHLKIRAKAFAERYMEGDLPANHIAGEFNPADSGTKALGAARHWKLCDLMGLHIPRGQTKLAHVSTEHKVENASESKRYLQAVIVACCLCSASAQPTPAANSEGDAALWVLICLVAVTSIALWEAGKAFVRCCLRYGAQRRPVRVSEESDERLPERQPDSEDELEEQTPLQLALQEIEREREGVREREREEQQQQDYEEGLRRRGARIYVAEPELEPPLPASPAMNPGPQSHIATQYLDDLLVAAPAEHIDRIVQEELNRRATGNPPAPTEIPPAPVREVRVLDFERAREEVLRGQREEQRMGLPPDPPIVIHPGLGPPRNQPPLREIQRASSTWGGLASALHQVLPVEYRRDFYQIDWNRNVLIRWHAATRVRLFTPTQTRLPDGLDIRAVTGRRRSFITEMARQYVLDDSFRGEGAQRYLEAEWRGRTELEISRAILQMVRPAPLPEGMR